MGRQRREFLAFLRTRHAGGTFAGLGTREVIQYIRSLGVTTVELLPIHTFVNDSHLLERGLTNYWGYNSIGFFAADPRYIADRARGVSEFKEMVADSLRYWVTEMHVDGFRFDLGTILAREPNGFDNQSGFLKVCSQDPILGGVKLIAEPWDCGPGGYQVGEFPPGWAEWNDKFRDTVRDYWRGQAPASALAPRLLGSGDIYDKFGRRPYASVNFVTAHDGYTLNDLVSYNDRHNEKNGENNQDGSSNNRSWNCGAEGPTQDAGVNALRDRPRRNILATLLLSQGTPMLLAGDEFGQTQQGNNNAYCQDNKLTWLDWNASEAHQPLTDFVRQLTTLRRKFPILRRNRFLTGVLNERIGIKEITWVHASGAEMTQEQWTDENMLCFAMILDGRAQATGTQATRPGRHPAHGVQRLS